MISSSSSKEERRPSTLLKQRSSIYASLGDSQSDSEEIFHKVYLVGNEGVGKKSLIQLMVNAASNPDGLEDAPPPKAWNVAQISEQDFITFGYVHPKNRIHNAFMPKSVDLVLIVCQLENKESIENVKDWVREVERYMRPDPEKIIIIQKNRQSFDASDSMDSSSGTEPEPHEKAKEKITKVLEQSVSDSELQQNDEELQTIAKTQGLNYYYVDLSSRDSLKDLCVSIGKRCHDLKNFRSRALDAKSLSEPLLPQFNSLRLSDKGGHPEIVGGPSKSFEYVNYQEKNQQFLTLLNRYKNALKEKLSIDQMHLPSKLTYCLSKKAKATHSSRYWAAYMIYNTAQEHFKASSSFPLNLKQIIQQITSPLEEDDKGAFFKSTAIHKTNSFGMKKSTDFYKLLIDLQKIDARFVDADLLEASDSKKEEKSSRGKRLGRARKW